MTSIGGGVLSIVARTWLRWKGQEVVPVQTTRNMLNHECSLVMASFAVSSSYLQLGMLSGGCFHTLDRSSSRVS